ncbi:carbohydrate-binding module family 43 protein [Plicaturopsis crispa FD-325 SS-3]|nr:carbohydrate-binding module family 43 protein [Plicaturopsis crispa FD-325 SS-3]
MYAFTFPFALVVLLASQLCSAALPPIQVKGSFLFDSSSGNRVYVKGVAYSGNYGSSETNSVKSSGTISALDPLGNAAGCARDVPFFQQLGVNFIRVYQVNASLDHSSCMAALDAAGIYVVLDLATPSAAINTDSPSWDVSLMTSFISTIEAFGSYSNVFGFNIGNEVINTVTDDGAAPFIKAAVRDIKTYLSAHGYTQLVGYTATDSPNSRAILPYYLACEDTASSIDYWGLNIYEWCGNSTFQTSGYQARTQELQNFGVPAFFSEFGCNAVTPRTFGDISTLFSSQMSDVWSGGIIYEYQEESNNFGLGSISSDGSSFTPNSDFTNLKSAYAAATPTSLAKASYTATVSEPVACPSSNASWPAATSLPPTPNADVCTCVINNLSCLSTLNEGSSSASIGTDLGTVCGLSSAACDAVSANGTTGTYGALSFCDPVQKLDIAVGAYYELQGRSASACDFGGVATLSTAGKPTDTAAAASATSACIASGFSGSTGIPVATSTAAGATTKPLVSGTGSSSSSSHSGAARGQSGGLLRIGAGLLVSTLCIGGGALLVLA